MNICLFIYPSIFLCTYLRIYVHIHISMACVLMFELIIKLLLTPVSDVAGQAYQLTDKYNERWPNSSFSHTLTQKTPSGKGNEIYQAIINRKEAMSTTYSISITSAKSSFGNRSNTNNSIKSIGSDSSYSGIPSCFLLPKNLATPLAPLSTLPPLDTLYSNFAEKKIFSDH